jgi:cytochrome c biogenesis protein CcdA/thiol-disulfide isomerase/thioredoxin
MALFLISFLGGILTIISPCILPVLPFVFSRADQPFRKSGLPLLTGMALTFAAFAAVAASAGGWIVRLNEYGRIAALVVLGIFGLTLLWPALGDRLFRPVVRLGGGLAQAADSQSQASFGRSLLLGVATGLLWAPCAGPILGLVLTGAAVEGTGARTALLLLAYAAGAATSLMIALLAGGRVFAALKRSLRAEMWIRRVLGVAVLAGVVAIVFGLDRGVLTQLSLANTSGLEQSLVDRVQPAKAAPSMMMMSATSGGPGPGPRTLPPLQATEWINSPPLTPEQLKGNVVLIDFWTYSCINCLRTLPYIEAWAAKYKQAGFVVIGVHTPEFAFERDPANVRRAVKDLRIEYPVAVDSDHTIWKAFNNSYWPADYLVDATGKIRYHHFGEGKYEESERQIQSLIKEKNGSVPASGFVQISATGAEAPPDSDVESPETYIGYERGESFMSPGGFVKDESHRYTAPSHLELNQWGLVGAWTDKPELAILSSAPGKIIFRFHARDVHLVLGPQASGKPVRYRVKIDGKGPGVNHGVDSDARGDGTIVDHRLYQLIRQKDAVDDRTFEIEFLDPGVQAFSFTFG